MGISAHGAGLFRRTAAGSAAAPRGCLRSDTLSLSFMGKREKAAKREESTRDFLQAVPGPS
jgi:hypothetical protein